MKLLYLNISLSLFCLLSPLGHLMAQCRTDQTWQSAWTSCQTSLSPNPARGEAHWLHYDLGYPYYLDDLYIWNANEAGLTQRGVKRMSLDYSLDGKSWNSWGEILLGEGTGSSYYPGERAAELDKTLARYVLLTVQETWGDSNCVSIHEVMMEIANPLTTGLDSDLDPLALRLYPNPTAEVLNLTFSHDRREKIDITLVNLMGQVLFHQNHRSILGSQHVQFSLPNLPTGLYVVQVASGESGVIGLGKLLIQP